MPSSVSLVTDAKPQLTLEAADAMATAAVAEATAKKFKDISVFVLDASGRVLVSKTMLNCPPLIPEIAHGKVRSHASTPARTPPCTSTRPPLLRR